MSFLLFYEGFIHNPSRLIKSIWNFGHVIYFYLLIFILINSSFFRQVSTATQVSSLLLIALLLGGLIEWIQLGSSRETSVLDLANDIIGASLAIVIHLRVNTRTIFYTITKLLIFGLLIFALSPIIKSLYLDILEKRQLPLLINFSNPYALEYFKSDAKIQIIPINKQAKGLSVVFDNIRFSGVGFEEFEPDWSQFKTLKLEFINPEKYTQLITLRIHDDIHHQSGNAYSDRFNQRYKIMAGNNAIQIKLDTIKNAPMQRKMNLSNVKNIKFFSQFDKRQSNLILTKISLQK